MHQAQMRIDVTDALDIGTGLSTAVTVFAPDRLASPPVVAFAFPGGGYSRGYYDIKGAAPASYSQAEHHTDRGWILVACDHLGVGDSSLPDPTLLDFEVLAAANRLSVEDVLARLAKGAAVDGLEPIVDPPVIGMGQSMGGCLLIVQQALHRSFDAIAVLGFSGIHTVLPTPPGGGDELSAEQFRFAFHWEDVPREIVDADLEGFPFRERVPPWGSATIPASAGSMLSPGCVADQAAAIDVPVFIGVGERDVCPDPHAEPFAYRRARDLTLYVLPRAAHMHNFAGTRALLWNRLDAWVGALVASR